MSNAFFYDLLASIADRGRSMLKIKPWPKDADNRVEQLVEDCRALVEGRGEASGVALAAEVIGRYRALDPSDHAAFFSALADDFGPDRERVRDAIANFESGRRRSGGERNPLRFRAAPSRAVPAAQSRAGRHRGAGRDARGPAPAREAEPVARHRRSRFSASVRFVVQSRLSGVAPHRLVLAGGASGKDHPLRGGARNRRLGRTQAAHRSGRPAMLRVLPSEAGRRAADLRRSRADAHPAGGDCAAACGEARACRAGQGARGGVLFDLELPTGSRGRQFRQLPHQAGGRGDPPRVAGDRDVSSRYRRFRDSAPGSRRPKIRRSRP